MAEQNNAAANGQIILTRGDAQKLEEKLEHLKVVKRPEVAERIKTARAFGDLSENAEYDAAKNEQAFIEGSIHDLEQMLRQAVIIEDSDINTDAVNVGNAVRVFDLEYEEEDEYTLVGSTQADPKKLHVTTDSPIGSALLGAHVGEVVTAQTPGGARRLRIIDIAL